MCMIPGDPLRSQVLRSLKRYLEEHGVKVEIRKHGLTEQLWVLESGTMPDCGCPLPGQVGWVKWCSCKRLPYQQWTHLTPSLKTVREWLGY